MDSERWIWLLGNYRSQDAYKQRAIERAYNARSIGVSDEATLYNIMMDIGVKLEGDDPCPPPPPPPITQDGAEQYDGIMAAEALMQP